MSKIRSAGISLLWLLVVIGMVILANLVTNKKVATPMTMQFVSGTEYNIGEAGQVIVEARFANGSSALAGQCLLSVWYPDKTLFTAMNGTTGPNGNQYIDFVVPNVTGVYEYQADCLLLPSGQNIVSHSFHVSEFQNDTSTKLNRVKAVMPK